MKYLSEKQFEKRMKEIQRKNRQIELKNTLKNEENKYKKFNLSKLKTSNVVLAIAIFAVISFSIACLYIQYATSVEVSSTLITLWYSFWTVEIVSLAGIKVSKVLKENKTKDTEIDFQRDDFENEDTVD